MEFLNPKPSKIAEWQALVLEAEVKSGYSFNENIENYLVITLDDFMMAEDWESSILAIDYLKALELSGKVGVQRLRHVGDQCLLLSGLFPEHALKKNVSLNYFVELGQQAYFIIGTRQNIIDLDPQLFHQLGDNFVGLMDVLHTMRLLK